MTSKHATIGFADGLRKELVGKGIRVSVVEPGLVDTPFIDWVEVRKRLPDVQALVPEDCARVIRFVLEQPPNCSLSEIVMRSPTQEM